MNLWDILILLLLLGAAVAAFCTMRRGKSRCSGNCAACGVGCAGKKQETPPGQGPGAG